MVMIARKGVKVVGYMLLARCLGRREVMEREYQRIYIFLWTFAYWFCIWSLFSKTYSILVLALICIMNICIFVLPLVCTPLNIYILVTPLVCILNVCIFVLLLVCISLNFCILALPLVFIFLNFCILVLPLVCILNICIFVLPLVCIYLNICINCWFCLWSHIPLLESPYFLVRCFFLSVFGL